MKRKTKDAPCPDRTPARASYTGTYHPRTASAPPRPPPGLHISLIGVVVVRSALALLLVDMVERLGHNA